MMVAAGMMKMATGDDFPLRQSVETGSRLVLSGYIGLRRWNFWSRVISDGFSIYRIFLVLVSREDGPRGEHNPLGQAGPLRRALVGYAPLGAPPRCCSGPSGVFWPTKKSTKTFVVFGLCLTLISCDVKNKQKTTTGTGHWVNRLVPKNDIKLL